MTPNRLITRELIGKKVNICFRQKPGTTIATIGIVTGFEGAGRSRRMTIRTEACQQPYSPKVSDIISITVIEISPRYFVV